MWKRLRELLVLGRDAALFVLPGIGFWNEVFKPMPAMELLILYMALMSTPGVAGAVWLARHGIEPPSSPSAPRSSSSPASSSRLSGGPDDGAG